MRLNELTEGETLNPPSISVGDEVKVGKFKNSKAEVKGFKKDDHGQPVLKTTKGDQKLYKPRVSKLEPGAIEEGTCRTCGGSGQVEWDHQDEFTGEHQRASAPCPDCNAKAKPAINTSPDLEEGDTKLDVNFDQANYKNVIKTLQDREISGKQKSIFLKSRIMRKLKLGGKVSRKEVLGMMDNLV